jgi:hypothetical protein
LTAISKDYTPVICYRRRLGYKENSYMCRQTFKDGKSSADLRPNKLNMKSKRDKHKCNVKKKKKQKMYSNTYSIFGIILSLGEIKI